MLRVAVVLAALCSTVHAQPAALVIREAAWEGAFGVPVDTTGWDRVVTEEGVVRLGAVLLTLSDGSVAGASVDFDPYTDSPQVTLELDDAAAAAFSRATAARVGQAIAVLLNGEVLTAPTVNEPIPNGRVQISGNFDVAKAERIARAIRDATGAEDVRRTKVLALRESVDLSTPRATVETYRAAAGVQDWLTVARLLHPAAVDELASGLETTLDIRADTLWSSDGTGRPLAVAEVLGPEVDGGRSGYGRVELLALALAAAGQMPPVAQAEITAVTPVGDHGAYVILNPEGVFGQAGFSQAQVLELALVGERWVLLVPLGGL